MKAKILKSNADGTIVIVYWDGDNPGSVQACTISVLDLPDTSNGKSVFELADDVVESGIVYGITGDQLLAEMPINYILDKMHQRGVWTKEDMINQSQFMARLMSSAILHALEVL